jgi:hypothetical protein
MAISSRAKGRTGTGDSSPAAGLGAQLPQHTGEPGLC